MSMKDLYDYIIDGYGKRGCFISEIAVGLGIRYDQANYLTYKIGYRRGRLVSLPSFQSFSNDAGVRYIQSII
ncbi:MAG: hypothetical protein K6B14_09475 [Lachnospiraceae bacterium]|nr:hypothetical protein [Lachnospiraceae bacterium]